MKQTKAKKLRLTSILLLITIVCIACSSLSTKPDDQDSEEDSSITVEQQEVFPTLESRNDDNEIIESSKIENSEESETIIDCTIEENTVIEDSSVENNGPNEEDIIDSSETAINDVPEEENSVSEDSTIGNNESIEEDIIDSSEITIDEVPEEENSVSEDRTIDNNESFIEEKIEITENIVDSSVEEPQNSKDKIEEETSKNNQDKKDDIETKQENTTADNTETFIEPETESTFSIHFIDVGQADAALIECDGHYMLIDGGNKGDSNKIYSILKNNNVPYLDIIVASHAHEDHIGGLPGALNYTSSKLTLCPVKSYESDAFDDFKKYADKNGNGITIPSVGDQYTLGSSTIKILAVNSGKDANNGSIILLIKYGDTSFLFTGDAEREAEQVLLNSGTDISSTLLKVGHHGSDTSTTYPFLREIMPQYAIISVGKDNAYGHPEDNTLSRLRDADVTVFRTDMQGDIYCTSNGKTITISVSRNPEINTLTNPTKEDVKPETQEKDSTSKKETEESTVNSDKTDYVLNTNTKKFHYPSCSSVKRMSEKNKAYHSGTREEILSMGYDPCGNCNP